MPGRKPLEFALARLSRRAHSEVELARKMLRAGYLREQVEPTLDYLRERRYLDDAAYARDFAARARERKHWGPARIASRLKERGLSDETVASALEICFPRGEEDEACAAALARFLRLKGPLSGRRGRARAYRHLLARGFSPEVVHRLVSGGDFEDTETSEPKTP